MKEPPDSVKLRLLYVLPTSLVEIRHLVSARKYPQLHDLADAVHPIAGYMARWKDAHLDSIKFNLRSYQEKYPEREGRFQYIEFLTDWADWEVPPF